MDTQLLGALLGAIPSSAPPAIWTVRHAAGHEAHVNLHDNTAQLPGALTVWDRAVTVHECGHIRWDMPNETLAQKWPALTMPHVLSWYKMVREWVIDARLVAEGFTPDPRIGMDRFDWSAMPDPANLDVEALALTWANMAYVNTGCQEQATKDRTGELWALLPTRGTSPLRALLETAFQECLASIWDDTLHADWAVRLAAFWPRQAAQPQPTQAAPLTQKYLEALQQAQQGQQATQQAQAALGQAMAQAGQPTAAQMQQAAQAAQAAQALQAAMPGQSGTGATEYGAGKKPRGAGKAGKGKSLAPEEREIRKARGRVPWGKDVVIHNHLTTARPGKRIKEPRASSEEGAVITHIERAFSDGRVFKEGLTDAGTVIIDGSGSMDWTRDDLEALIDAAPSVVVGVYTNRQTADWRNFATICIVAKGGRRADDFFETCGKAPGNAGSDLPALRWLADPKQRGPKFIVSDGKYWGECVQPKGCGRRCADEHTCGCYHAACNAAQKAGKILRVRNMDQLVRAARRKPASISDGCQHLHEQYRRPQPR